MEIHWAVFGERNRGHDLLATSGDDVFARRIVQFTDRPGDPPLGVSWGPVDSGFRFEGHYMFLRTMPDLEVGRPGMVRSYVAYVSLDHLATLSSLIQVFDQLPTKVVAPTSLAVTFPPNISASTFDHENFPGLDDIASKLASSSTQLPLVWASDCPYLPTLDAMWGNLPPELRSSFVFSFQFAPEHKLPEQPIIVATLPQLSGRWPSTQLIDINNTQTFNTAEHWFSNRLNSIDFVTTLTSFGIKIQSFNELELLSQFAVLVAKWPEITFKNLLRAVRIVERQTKSQGYLGEGGSQLFTQLCKLCSDATDAEIVALRNLNPAILGSYIPTIQTGVTDWLDKSAHSQHLIEVINLALEDESSWWSQAVFKWGSQVSLLANPADVRTIWLLAGATKPIFNFISKHLSKSPDAESSLILYIPERVTQICADRFLPITLLRGWLRLHALLLLRSDYRQDAIKLHAAVACDVTDGFKQIVHEIGIIKLLTVASELENESLTNFAAEELNSHLSTISIKDIARGPNWVRLLTATIQKAKEHGPLTGKLRSLAISAIKADSYNDADLALLCEVVSNRDITIWFDVVHPIALLDRLSEEQKNSIIFAINDFLSEHLSSLNSLKFSPQSDFNNHIDFDKIASSINRLVGNDFIVSGISAFELFSQMPDLQFRHWLVDLFTRTYQTPICPDLASRIAILICNRDYQSSAEVVRDTVENYQRYDVSPILEQIRYKFKMIKKMSAESPVNKGKLPVVLVATALPLERSEVVSHLDTMVYDAEVHADVAFWPPQNPSFEIWVLATGAGNLDAQASTLNALHNMPRLPSLAFFVGVGGGLKDSDIGDVIYSNKVYYYEGGKEEDGGLKSRPNVEHSSKDIEQLAIRVSDRSWQPAFTEGSQPPKARPAVIGSGEKVLTSVKKNAKTFQRIKNSYNDTQVVDMEGFGFLKACREQNVPHAMVLRGVSDLIAGKSESDAKGNQPVAVKNATAFLFELLKVCTSVTRIKHKPKHRKKIFGLF